APVRMRRKAAALRWSACAWVSSTWRRRNPCCERYSSRTRALSVPMRPEAASKSSTGSTTTASPPACATWLQVPVGAWKKDWTASATSAGLAAEVGVEHLRQSPGRLAHPLLGQRAEVVEVGVVHLVPGRIDAARLDQAARLGGPCLGPGARAVGWHRWPGQGI